LLWWVPDERSCHRERDFEAHFVKPLDPEALLAVIARVRYAHTPSTRAGLVRISV
jgi:elongation factor P hydroxylase